jgi:predicted HNH restriction endonuclease
MKLELYQEYSRKDAHHIFAPDTNFTPQSGTWGLQGIVRLFDRNGDFIFFVTLGQKQGEHIFDEGITEDGILSWQPQPKQGFNHAWIQAFINHDEARNSIYLFFRTDSRRNYVYLGKLKYLSHDSQREYPVHFQWKILNWNIPRELMEKIKINLLPSSSTQLAIFPDEVANPETYYEGATRQVNVNVYERNSKARKDCIAHYGPNCSVCGFNFKQFYGEFGEDYIHVHHLQPLSEIGEEYELDPIQDLRPVCPNCHAMLHRSKSVSTIESLQQLVKRGIS